MLFLKQLPNKYLTFILFYLSFTVTYSQNMGFCDRAALIVKTAEKYHYNPRAVDDKFSELVFSNFINILDPYGFYFTHSEYEQLEQYKYSIVEDIIQHKSGFLQKSTQLYLNKLLFVDSLITSFENHEFDFNQNDIITFTKTTQFVSRNQLIDRWEKSIKLHILTSYFSDIDSGAENQAISSEKILALKNTILINENCRSKSKINYSGGIEEYVVEALLKAIASAFDPHTNYFSQTAQSEFITQLSKEKFSFGFDINRNDFGEIEILQIIPGSPTWNSNLMNEGDVIMSVKALGKEKDFNCISTDEVMFFLANDEVKEADFLIRKKNGKQFSLTLVKEKLDIEENVIRSFVLEGEKNIGYIYLPVFYSQIANDVAKELVKLRKENISGLIIDLRNNGGGSMMEAILLSGIFVDYGAVGIIQTRNEPPTSLKDAMKGTIYDGPLIIMINSYSASASELFTASMQDLNRAVIVGNTSFGKATMQQIIPIDACNYPVLEQYRDSSKDFVKLTIGEFYRVTGESHQKKGVIPDVELPYNFDNYEVSERSFASALNPTFNEKKVYYYPQSPQPVSELKTLSEARIKKDSVFIDLENKRKKISEEENKFSVPVNFNSFMKFIQSKEKTGITYKKQSAFSVKKRNDIEAVTGTSNKDIIVNAVDQMERDYYLGEAYHIINDLVNIKNR
ncbi:MAG: carboxy terminal-processing peptidase [Bacteroidales bacterium]|nr:carboxy terminal-processing peptidase [Bacteroidales bacterium]